MENIVIKYPSFFVGFAGNWHYGFKDEYLIYKSQTSDSIQPKLINKQ